MRIRYALFCAVALTFLIAAPAAHASMTWHVLLSGSQEVPANASTATGNANFTLNDVETQLTVHLDFSGLLTAQTGAHIHNAPPGVNGGIVFGLPLGSPVDVVWAIPPAMVVELKAGRLYVNVHSNAFPGGEIRGNIVAATPTLARSWGIVKALYH